MSNLLLVLVLVAFIAIQLLIGGTRLIFSVPTYGVLAVAALLSWIPTWRREIPARVLPCLAASAIFFGYVLLRTVFSPMEYIARTDLFMVLGALMLYLLTTLNLTSSRTRMAMVLCLLALGMANFVIGAMQFMKGQNFMAFDFLQRADYGIRASGFYVCPNHLAGFLEVAALMGLSVACWSRWKAWVRFVIGYASLMCLGGVIITGSRGGYVSTVVGLVVFAGLGIAVVRKQNPALFWRVLLGTLLLIAVIWFGVERVVLKHDFLKTRVANIATTNDIRVTLWPAAIDQFQLNPVVGTGSGTFLIYGRQFRRPGMHQDPVYAHNDYLHFLAEFGVVGMLGFLLFLAAHLRSGFQAFAGVIANRRTAALIGSNSLALNIGALAAVAAYLVHSFVDFNLHIPANALLMAFVFGVLTNSGSLLAARDSEVKMAVSPATRYLRFVLPALAIWLAIAALPTLPAEYYAERSRRALRDWRFAESEAFADLGLPGDPRNPYLYYYKGEAIAGMAETAIEPNVRERLYEQSIQEFNKAIKLFPQEENFVLSIGWSLDALKRFEESESVFLRALELDPNSPQVRFYYAAHLHLRGKRDAAEEAYKRAVALGSYGAAMGLQRLAEESKAGGPNSVVSAQPAP